MAKSGRVARTGSPRRALTQLAAIGATGVLRVGGTPGGRLYLVDGRVTLAESPAAPGVGDLLVASGRLASSTWEDALAGDGPDHAVGPRLVERGHLTPGELELCVLGALYDAAYFTLSVPTASLRFDDQRHWLGEVVSIDPAVLSRECTRRRKLLDDIHPVPEVDHGPVRPVPRAPMPRVVLSGLQWELLVHTDGRRTASAIAHLLGTSGFSVVQELRRLAAAGLVGPADAAGSEGDAEAGTPRQRAGAVPPIRSAAPAGGPSGGPAGGPAETVDATGAPPAQATERPTAPAAARAKALPVAAKALPVSAKASPVAARAADNGNGKGAAKDAPAKPGPPPAPLPKREPGARLPALPDPGSDGPEPADEALLKRIRTALKALR